MNKEIFQFNSNIRKMKNSLNAVFFKEKNNERFFTKLLKSNVQKLISRTQLNAFALQDENNISTHERSLKLQKISS